MISEAEFVQYEYSYMDPEAVLVQDEYSYMISKAILVQDEYSYIILEAVLIQDEYSYTIVIPVRRAAEWCQYAVKRAEHVFRGHGNRARALAEVHALQHAAVRSSSAHVVAIVCASQAGGHLYAQLELCELGSVRAEVQI
ncbi:hypothetical protein JKP88DRAFT_287701 [Tribonema minus]|uniref:Uncharacterized protein n=1 Tax=Tribonema minus TaxID=303371 RepID=A0A835Z9I9_9STRA|nr:hypothetical protein JKP88DRAFT_287701 [Tribonema minus]